MKEAGMIAGDRKQWEASEKALRPRGQRKTGNR